MGRGLLVMGYRARFASQLDHQLLCLNLNAGDPGSYETAIINRWGRFEVLPNRFDDQRLNSSCWHSMDRSGANIRLVPTIPNNLDAEWPSVGGP